MQALKEALSLPIFKRITIGRCYRILFAHRIAPQLLYDALGQDSLLACGFRNRLILHALDEVTRTSGKPTLFEGALPARHGTRQKSAAFFLTPFPHIRNVIQSAVGDRLHGFSLAA